ncbi:hypothetical protein LXL04_003069 [Taraxacum kok-saghyz]
MDYVVIVMVVPFLNPKLRNDDKIQLDNLVKLPKNLLAKASTIKNTQQVLEQMPQVISSLDAHMDHGLQSVPHLETVTRLLSNIENSQLKPLADITSTQLLREEPRSDTSTPQELGM